MDAIGSAFFLAFIVFVGLYSACKFFDRCIDEMWPPSSEAIAKQQAKELIKKANKDLKKRKLLRVLRFWKTKGFH